MRTSDYAGLILHRSRTFLVAVLVVVLAGIAGVLVASAQDSTVEADARIEATGTIRERDRYAVDSQGVAVEAINAAEAALSTEAMERRARAALGVTRPFGQLKARVKTEAADGTAALTVTVSARGEFPTTAVAQWYVDEAVAVVERFAEARIADPTEISVEVTEPVELKDRPTVRRAMVAAVLVVLGLIVGVGAALIRGLTDRRVRYAVDVRRAFGESATVITDADGQVAALASLVAASISEDGPTVAVVRSLEGYRGETVMDLAAHLQDDGRTVRILGRDTVPTHLRTVSAQLAGAAPGDVFLIDVSEEVPAALSVPAIQVADIVIVGLRSGVSKRASLEATVAAVDLLDPSPFTVFHLA